MDALAQLGMVSDPLPAHDELAHDEPAHDEKVREENGHEETSAGGDAKDYFVTRDGLKFAGAHLLLDLWGAENLTDPKAIERALADAAHAAQATILHAHLHQFSPDGGVSGVLVLAESHISIHTWPEREFAAIDIFMCGSCDPYRSVPVLKAAFHPRTIQLSEQRRGLIV